MLRHILSIAVITSSGLFSAAPNAQEKAADDLTLLKKQMRDGDAAVRLKALQALSRLPALDANLADEIFELGADQDVNVRREAMQRLGRLSSLKSHREPALKMLHERIKDADGTVRYYATYHALHADAPRFAADATAVLVDFLKNRAKDKQHASSALYLLRLTGQHGKAAQTELVAIIKQGDDELLPPALETMLALKLDLKPLLPELAKRASKAVSRNEADVLGMVFAAHDMPELSQVVRSMLLAPSRVDPTTVVANSRFFQEHMDRACAALIPLLKDADPIVRAGAALILTGEAGPLKRTGPMEVQQTVQKLAGSSKELTANLRANLNDKHRHVRWYSAYALVVAKATDGADLTPLAVKWLREDANPPDRLNHGKLAGRLLALEPERAAALVFDVVAGVDDVKRERFAFATYELPPATLKPHLIKAIEAKEAPRRRYAIAVLRHQLRARAVKEIAALTPYVVKTLDDDAVWVRLDAAALLINCGAKEEARIVAVLIQAVDGTETAPRIRAVQLLNNLGKKAAPARPALVRALDDASAELQLSAVAALLLIDPAKIEPVLPVLKRFLDKPAGEPSRMPNMMPRVLALTSQAGPAARPLVPEVLAVVEDKKSPHRLSAAMTLLHIDARRTEPVVRVVLERLDGKETNLHQDLVVDLLRRLGPAAKPALPLVQKRFEKAKSDRLYWAITSAMIDPSDENPAMRQVRNALTGKGKNVEDDRFDALDELEQTGPQAKVFLPELTTLLKTTQKDAILLGDTVRVLAAIGPDAKETLPQLEALAKGATNMRLRTALQDAIARISVK